MLDLKLKNALINLKAKIGNEIRTHDELVNYFVNNVIRPYLQAKAGFLAEVYLERRIKRGIYDARVGNLIFEFETPGKGIYCGGKECGKCGICQAKRYIDEFRSKGLTVRFFVTDGITVAFVDENKRIIDEKPIETVLDRLLSWLELAIMEPVEPEDLLKILSLSSDICRTHIRTLYTEFRRVGESLPFVKECFELWRKVYGEATNLNEKLIKVVKENAKSLEIKLKDRGDVERFLFVVETYLSLLMKILLVGIAIKRKLVGENSVIEIFEPDPLAIFGNLSKRLPIIKNAFDLDAFDWIVDIAGKDIEAESKISSVIRDLAIAVDKLKLEKLKIDMLRKVYQNFFDAEFRKALGEFYTNEEMVEEVLDAVGYKGENILDKVLIDPACGSGTFLIIAIGRFIEEARKRGLTNFEILQRIQNNIIGIDIHPFAIAMARVNYLIAISELLESSTIKEIKIPIYWTDSLAHLKKSGQSDLSLTSPVIVDVTPLGTFKLPDPKDISWDKLFEAVKSAIERNWSEKRFLEEFGDEGLRYENTLLEFLRAFKERVKEGKDSRWLPTLRNVLVVEQYKGRCHFVVGNPPWVRVHNVEEHLRTRISENFKFYGKGASWNPNLSKTKVPFREQADYALAFLERGLDFLDKNGKLGFVITSNIVRSLYAGATREYILKKTKILKIFDYSLSRRELFERAQNAPLILALERVWHSFGIKEY